jgi:cytochrome c553
MMKPLHPAVLLAAACLLACGRAGAQASAPAAPQDPMAQRMQACTLCHGKEGRATPEGYFPRIAGKPAGYLYNQLVNFRDGRRGNAVMTYLVEHLSDDYLREIAHHFSSLDLPYPPAPRTSADAATLQRGQVLVQQGDRQRQLPACAACHGQQLTGVNPAVPGLLGLSRDYLVAQLGAWRNGTRHAIAPDCMKTVAERLSPEDLSAVATWLAAQTPPRDAKPQAAASAALPLDCGGLKP